MIEDLHDLLSAGESAQLEYKRTLADDTKIIETIAAMATIGGGTILVGVRDDGTPVGVSLGSGARERFVQRVMAAIDPKIYLDIDEPVTEGLPLLRIRVPPGDGPHLARGRAFYRSGPAPIALSRDEYERRLLARLRESGGFERLPDSGSSLEDIDRSAVESFVARAQPRGVVAAADPVEILHRLRLVARDHLTTAGQLLFGRRPQEGFPQATIRARAARGVASDSAAIEGNLFEQIDRAHAFILRNLRTRSLREGITRADVPELPPAAVREIIANAVAHRDYRSTAPTQLTLDDDALVVWNPGHLPPPLTAAKLRERHPSVPPNPLLARALFLAGYIEEWGTGTNRVVAAMAANQNPEPLFEEVDDGLRVTLPLPGGLPAALSPRQLEFLTARRRGDRFTTADYAAATGIAKRTALGDLRALADKGLVAPEGRGKAARWVRQ